ncbi:hypothetical protein [Cellulosilyticum lentocellum]|uniref:hypothetical protein n=1 Tax=Cellulosilyticum lentocellum TaxID=29360 RepID=UPI0001D2DD48|nr:hypothetical protein [Cellulosilyticum lentocellum]
MTLPELKESFEFLFKPDFSKIAPCIIISAIGQAFFSLSLGMGVLITYIKFGGRTLFITLDYLTNNINTPLVAVLAAIVATWICKTKSLNKELDVGNNLFSYKKSRLVISLLFLYEKITLFLQLLYTKGCT